MYLAFGKRFFDIAVSLTLLVLAAPVLTVVAMAVRWRLGSPVLFRQLRPGLNERLFRVLKFRTMTDARDTDGRLRPDDQRLTRLGRFLRTWSLDELPQLFNVLRGDMSLIGPRPLLTRYLPRYTPRQHQRHAVRPGITGLAQIRGRNDLEWPRRLALDVWYAEHASLTLDLSILWQTVVRVLDRRGVRAGGGGEVSEF
ncbi:MAG: sugar transferase, partial [Patescibacteria group bacterium]|nr:sugar transferase [Patescibacteria group bacterium]